MAGSRALSPSYRVLSGADVDAAVDVHALLGPIREAFISLSSGQAHVPVRAAVNAGVGTTLLMGAHVPGVGLAGKIVSVFPANVARGLPTTRGLLVLLDPETGGPLAVCDGARLTAWRTGAASAVATQALSRPDARIAAVFGAGAQAETQILGIDAVRELDEIQVFARDRARLEAFVRKVGPHTRAPVVAAADAATAVRRAHIICTATTSSTPVFPGDALQPGAHINAVGAFTPQMRELDTETVRRSRVFVDHMPAALAEAGDLLTAELEGGCEREAWQELGFVLDGSAAGRQDDHDITLFKSVGNAAQDVAAGTVLLRRALERDLGIDIAT